MKLKQTLAPFIILCGMLISLTACGSTPGGSSASNGEVSFWAASNPPQLAFWTQMAKEYTAKHPGVKVNVKQIPESPSSEAGIQAALAGGAGPTASENIFTGFGGQLQKSQAIVPLDQMPGWNDVLKARHMDSTIQSWKFSDGHTYILPMYSNAMLFGWRMDILKQIGFTKAPRTYSEVLAVGKALKAKYPNKFIWARDALVKDTWYERWFDFFPLYDAASNGQTIINGGKITANDQAAIGTLGFLNSLAKQKSLLTQTATDPFENGLAVADIIGPWRFAVWDQKYKNLKLHDNYELTPPPVPDAMASSVNDTNTKTFADAKGIVIYKQASADQQAKIWDFVKWTLSDPNHDLTWLQQTGLPAARDDLNTNTLFQPYLSQHAQLAQYAKNIPNGVPPMTNPKYSDIQVALGNNAVIPSVQDKTTPDKAWQDWKSAVQPSLNQ
ncbi:sugar ABC transporter substrate-binding protein [Dictyobacter vulcani]|uniref:Sugar ABC transporter substrate-binding protein n=1 Tax=Dictyobacter vulcani TaxID=2607529 RepID=A0A5J4KWT1_9CHLR|nr:ABC transporter substrate-binding protein [Dictyobacter vulcani]GER90990.1 sugar ABC transporter substrate-binding protein [Dictyobacter vulcani]